MSREFQNALSNFTQEAANGGAIRHLADLGYSPEEIYRELDFPCSRDQIGKTMWKHFTENGTIRLEPLPENQNGQIRYLEKVSYVTDRGKFGSTSLRRVVTREELPAANYYPCDYGKRIYQNKEDFVRSLAGLSESDRNYILGLPWPLQTVYHIENERMKRIASAIVGKE